MAGLIRPVPYWLVMLVGCATAPAEDVPRDPDPVRVVFRGAPEDAGGVRVEVAGLNPSAVQRLASAQLNDETWRRLLAIFVATQGEAPAPAMLGDYRVEEDSIVFKPRFPLRAGVTYRAVFDPAALPGGGSANEKPVEAEFSLPKPKPETPTRVTAVYPTRDTLPENQLKFYLQFSVPMSRGEAYEHIHLLNDQGERVEHPFLELGEELWDPSGQRLTLFFDPGRIKRGLQPRELFGPSLEEGRSYTLVVVKTWPDAAGRPLQASFRKKFKVTAPDDVQPDPARWTVSAPADGTRDPLTVTFGEPLDHGMLQRVLVVRDSAGRIVRGEIEVDRQETRWRLLPDGPWSAGRYQLVVATTLEDLAGNSIGRPFEVDVVRPIEKRIERETIALPFEIPAAR